MEERRRVKAPFSSFYVSSLWPLCFRALFCGSAFAVMKVSYLPLLSLQHWAFCVACACVGQYRRLSRAARWVCTISLSSSLLFISNKRRVLTTWTVPALIRRLREISSKSKKAKVLLLYTVFVTHAACFTWNSWMYVQFRNLTCTSRQASMSHFLWVCGGLQCCLPI